MSHLSLMSLSWSPSALALALLPLWGAGYTEVKSASRQETPTAPAASVTIVQVNPRAIPIHKEYTGSTDATETAEIRARVDGFIEPQLFDRAHLWVVERGLEAGDRVIVEGLQRVQYKVEPEPNLELAADTTAWWLGGGPTHGRDGGEAIHRHVGGG